MKVILLPSGSVMADNCTPLFTISTAPGAKPLPETSAMMPDQVVHRKVQQARAGAFGVEGDLDPTTVGHPPFDEATLHGQVVGWAPKETFIPGAGCFKVAHRDNCKNELDGHRALLLLIWTRRQVRLADWIFIPPEPHNRSP